MFKRLLSRQFRKPAGVLGHYAAHFMNKNNQDYYRRVINLLEIKDTDRVLEIGCGAGQAIRLIAQENKSCVIDGIDFSSFMIKKARRNNRAAIKEGRVSLISGDITGYIFRCLYNRAFAINVIYFWNDILPVLKKLHSILRPGGRCVIYMSSPERLRQIPFAVDEVFHKYSLEYVTAQLGLAGFARITHETVEKAGLATYYIIADKS